MKLLKRLFVVPSDEKVTEKCMTRVMVCSVFSILLCVVCLASTTWAWYGTQITSENNVIRGGHWEQINTLESVEETTQATEEDTVPEIVDDTEKTQEAEEPAVTDEETEQGEPVLPADPDAEITE